MTARGAASAVHYDPYDVDIDNDPYPTWRRLRDEAPLYRNDEHDFYAVSRWKDVKPALLDRETFRSGARDGARDRQSGCRDPAWNPAVRGPADPRCSPSAVVACVHAKAHARPRAARAWPLDDPAEAGISKMGSGAGAMLATAMRVVNAVPYVGDAAPGLLRSLEMPLTLPRHAFRA